MPQTTPVHVQNPKEGVYTLEKFIKNATKVFKGTTNPEKAKAWTLNMIKFSRSMEVQEDYWVRLVSCMFENVTAFQRYWSLTLWEGSLTPLLGLNFYRCLLSKTIQNG